MFLPNTIRKLVAGADKTVSGHVRRKGYCDGDDHKVESAKINRMLSLSDGASLCYINE